MRLDDTARGVFVIPVTPFDDRGGLDLSGIDRRVDRHLPRVRCEAQPGLDLAAASEARPLRAAARS